MTNNTKIEHLLTLPESKTLDFKRDLTGKFGVIKTLISFANSAGGTVVVGVDDDKTIIGLEKPMLEEERLANIIANNIVPAVLPKVSVVTVDEKSIMIVEVFPSGYAPHYYKKAGKFEGTYLRLGSTNRQADSSQIAELERNSISRSFDREINRFATIDDLDMVHINEVIGKVKAIHNKTLVNSDIVADDQGQLMPTNGGLILFAKDVRKFFPDVWVQCGRFSGKTKANILDHTEIYAQPFEAVDKVMDFIRKYAMRGFTIDGSDRVDVWNVPLFACRELVINALVHADYSMRGTNIRLEIFDDRIEIESPGLLVKGMTVEEMITGRSIPRNPMIAQIFQDTGKSEKWGSGIPRAIDEVQAFGLPDISFAEHAGQVIATIYVDITKPRSDESTNLKSTRDYQPIDKLGDKIVDYLKLNDSIKSAKARELLGKSASTTRRVFDALEEKGLIVAEGSNRARIYRLKD